MHAFTLEYTAESKWLKKKKKGKTIDQCNLIHIGNRLHLKGTELTGQAAKGLNNTGGGILTSPFFPARYPRDLGLEYVVICPNEASSCRIRLLFSDFQLATVSIMEVSEKMTMVDMFMTFLSYVSIVQYHSYSSTIGMVNVWT